jgi:hypothetical protein
VPRTNDIDDHTIVVAMADRQCEGVLPAAARIDVREIAYTLAWQQLAAIGDDARRQRLGVNERRNALPKLAEYLAALRRRVVLLHARQVVAR